VLGAGRWEREWGSHGQRGPKASLETMDLLSLYGPSTASSHRMRLPCPGSTRFAGAHGTAIDLILPPVLGLRLPAGKLITEDGLPAR
jgi:hypothetical protein